jgi:hypothetical protein
MERRRRPRWAYSFAGKAKLDRVGATKHPGKRYYGHIEVRCRCDKAERGDSRHPDRKQDHLDGDAERVQPVADVGDRPVVCRLDLAVLGERRDDERLV